MVQSVKAICNALAAVETPEITNALNQLPPCPSRMKPKIQKVTGPRALAWGRRRGKFPGNQVTRCPLTKRLFSQPPSFMFEHSVTEFWGDSCQVCHLLLRMRVG